MAKSGSWKTKSTHRELLYAGDYGRPCLHQLSVFFVFFFAVLNIWEKRTLKNAWYTQENLGKLSKGNKGTQCCTGEQKGDEEREIVFSIMQRRDSEGKCRAVLLGEYDKQRRWERGTRWLHGWVPEANLVGCTYRVLHTRTHTHYRASTYRRHSSLALTCTFCTFCVLITLCPFPFLSIFPCHCVSVVFPVFVTLSSPCLPSSYLSFLSKQTSQFPPAQKHIWAVKTLRNFDVIHKCMCTVKTKKVTEVHYAQTDLILNSERKKTKWTSAAYFSRAAATSCRPWGLVLFLSQITVL